MTTAQLAFKVAETIDFPSSNGPAVPARMIREYAPIGDRRELSPDEESQVAAGESQWAPKLIETDSTTIPDMLASPARGAVAAGAIGAGAGALAGGGIGKLVGHPAIGAAAGAALGGLPAALHTFLSRHHHNDHLLETMRRLPEGATKRDYDAVELLGQALGRRYKAGAEWTRPGSSNRHVNVRGHKRKPPYKRKASRKSASDASVESVNYLTESQIKAWHDGLKNQLGQHSPVEPPKDDLLAMARKRRGEDEHGNSLQAKAAEKRGPAGEYCPHCDARLERGDDGNCNRCGKAWPEKAAAQRTCECGATMRGAWCDACRKFNWTKAGGIGGELGEEAGNLAGKTGIGQKLMSGIGHFFGGEAGSAAGEEASHLAVPAMKSLVRPTGSMGQRITTGLTSAGVAGLDPAAQGHRLSAMATGGLAGFAAPQPTQRALGGYMTGGAVDAASHMMGYGDPKARYIGAAGNWLAGSPEMRQFAGAASEMLPAGAQKPVQNAGNFASGFVGDRPTSLNPAKFEPTLPGSPLPAPKAPLSYQAGQVAARPFNAVFNMPFQAAERGVSGAVSGIGKGMRSLLDRGESSTAAELGQAAGRGTVDATPTVTNEVLRDAAGRGTDPNAALRDAAVDGSIGPQTPAEVGQSAGQSAGQSTGQSTGPTNGAAGQPAVPGQGGSFAKPMLAAGIGTAVAAAAATPVILNKVNATANAAANAGAQAGAQTTINKTLGITPEVYQNQIKPNQDLIDALSSNDPATLAQAQQKAKAMNVGLRPDGTVDVQAAKQSLQQQNAGTMATAALQSAGVKPADAAIAKSFFDAPDKKQFIMDTAKRYMGDLTGGASGFFSGLSGMADELLGKIPGFNVGTMTGMQKILLLLGGLGLLGGAIGGSGFMAGIGGAALLGGLAMHGGPLSQFMPGQSPASPATTPAPVAGASPVTPPAVPASRPAVSSAMPQGQDLMEQLGQGAARMA